MQTTIRVLLIEDNPGDTRLVKESLSATGNNEFSLVWVPDLATGFTQIKDHEFDVILLDLGLPDSTGIATFEKIFSQVPHIPIILLTGLADDDLAIKAVRLGAQDYIVKWEAVGNGELKRVIRYAIERKQAEERFHLVVESAPNAIILVDRQGRIVMVNSQAEKYFGYTRGELLELVADDLVPGRFRTHHKNFRQTYLANPKNRSMGAGNELFGLRKDGSEFPVEVGLTPIETPDGSLVMATIIDITERKQAEDALRESEERFRALIENSSDAIILIGSDGNILYDSPAASRILGYERDELIGRNAFELVHPDDLEGLATEFSRLVDASISAQAEFRYQHKDGSWRWVEAVGTNLLKSPAVRAIVINYHDITERRRSQEKIQQQLRRIKSLRKIDQAISGMKELRFVLEVALNQGLKELNVDAGVILLYDPQNEILKFEVGTGMQTKALRHTHLKLGDGYAGRVALSRQTMFISDLQKRTTDFLRSPSFSLEGFKCYFGVPLISKDRIIGVLEIFNRSRLNPEQEWLDFMETVAGQIAIAIHNAQLWEQTQNHARELEQRVEERTQELQHANRAKDQFLANMSHELRTPLNGILGMSEMLLEQRRDSLSPHQQKSLEVIESSGRHLLELINDILDLSKIEARQLDVYQQPIDVGEICRSSLVFVKSQALKKSINLTYEEDKTVSNIYVDPRRIKQILVNLLTNAIKFTPEKGQVTLQVHADADQDLVQFSVVDTGIGIAEHDLKQLFQPFTQIDSSLNRQQEGTGLGLALVQKLTDLHGGSVHVESQVGVGSNFTINLPWGRRIMDELEGDESSNAELAGNQPKKRSGETLERRTVLLAEDNPSNVLTVGEYLEDHGYEVLVAHDGQEAIDMAEKNKPDIILMDIQMPVMNGFDAMQKLRAEQRFKSTPIITLTALAMPGDRERCLEAGANEYMSKPVSLKKLVKTIGELLS